jgi:hypothetical protein
MAPVNIAPQNTIDEFGRIIAKDCLTHDQCFKWGHTCQSTAESTYTLYYLAPSAKPSGAISLQSLPLEGSTQAIESLSAKRL